MCNNGKNTNTSQFFFTLSDSCAKLTGKHVCFGEIVEGADLLEEIDASGPADAEGKPTRPVIIRDCGVFD